MNALEIQSIINAKEKRQFVLEERKKTILEIDEAINESSFNKNIKGIYYFLKRFVLIFVSISLIIFSCICLFSPELIIKNNFKDEIKSNFKNDYKDEKERDAEFVFANVSKEIFLNKNDYSSSYQIESVIKNSLEKLTEKKAEDNFVFFTKFLAFMGFAIASILLYISRLTKKLKERNELLLSSDELTKIVIDDYNKTLEEEKDELLALKKAYFATSHI